MDFRISANFSNMKTFMSLIFRGLSFESTPSVEPILLKFYLKFPKDKTKS